VETAAATTRVTAEEPSAVSQCAELTLIEQAIDRAIALLPTADLTAPCARPLVGAIDGKIEALAVAFRRGLHRGRARDAAERVTSN
jgi:hypothetical protein